MFGEQTAEILFEIITECMDDYLYIFDLQNNTFEISQSAVERFNMSKNVLTDAANEVMNVVYEEDRRMLAKHLADICEGKENVHNITEISEMTGFNDVKYFREVFKKHYNVSPSQYFKEKKEDNKEGGENEE